MLFRLEMVTVPVADVDRAETFYVDQLGCSTEQDVQVDGDHRFVELVPPGSARTIALTSGYIDAEPGSLQGARLNVEDADEAHEFLREHGVPVTELQEFPWGRFCFFSDLTAMGSPYTRSPITEDDSRSEDCGASAHAAVCAVVSMRESPA